MRKSIITISCVAAALAAAAALYQYGYTKYKDTFLPNTIVNQTDVSGLTIRQAEEKIRKPLNNIFIHYMSSTEEIQAKDLHAASSYEASLKKEFNSQNHHLWFMAYQHPSSFHAVPDIYYDTKNLGEIIENLSFVKNYEEPVNAEIIYQNGMFQIQKETEGTKPDIPQIEKKITESVQSGNYNIDVSECRVLPSVAEKDLSLTDQMKDLNARDRIEIDVGGGQTCALSKEEFQDIIVWDGEISLDDQKLSDLLQNLSDTYSTFGKLRQFTTHAGDEITVGGSVKDDFGYAMDTEQTKKIFSDAIMNGKDSCTIAWKQEGKTRSEQNDFGNTYAEVSIKQQHAWYYKNGECVFDSDTVTGLPALGGTTPGVFHILYKQSPSVLKGENYETPVTYWMPFTYTGTGFHDAYWRSKFGGDLYLTTGSHGCVNLPAGKAKELYGLIQTGDPVIVY